MHRSQHSRLAAPLCCAAALLLAQVGGTLAQDEMPLGGGAIIIEHNGVRLVTEPTGDAASAALPNDEELAKVNISDRLLGLTALLDDPDFEVRQKATQSIIDWPGDKLQIYALLSRHTLSTEQHYRLMTAVRERLINAPRGALGISMPVDRNDIEVIDLLPGLPAEKVLEIGDRIIAIDGERLHIRTDLTAWIQSKRPGEQVSLTIHRLRRDERGNVIRNNAGQPVREERIVEVTLGSAELLRDPATGRPQINPVVAHKRRDEAAAVDRRFKIKPLTIELADDIPLPKRSALEREVDEVVDNHPAIRFLLRYREHVEARGGHIEPGILEQTLNMLRLELRDPQLPAENRDILERVIERYEELLLHP